MARLRLARPRDRELQVRNQAEVEVRLGLDVLHRRAESVRHGLDACRRHFRGRRRGHQVQAAGCGQEDPEARRTTTRIAQALEHDSAFILLHDSFADP